MTRILHVVPDLVPYGLERVVASLVALRDRGRFQSDVVSLYAPQEGSLGSGLERSGARVYYLNKRKGLDPRMFGRFTEVLREAKPDIVHTHNYVLRYTIPPAILQRVPVQVHTIHNVAHRESDLVGRLIQRWAFRRTVHPVAIADEVLSSYLDVYKSPLPSLIPNGIAVDDYTVAPGTREKWRVKEGFAPDDLLYVCIARLFAQKNHKTLLEAFAAGPAAFPKAKLVLAGDGELLTALEALACELRIRDRVRFLGRRQDVAEILAASDVFTLASLWEGNPLSVMEAMAAGRASVVTAVGGVPELVENEKQGFVVRPNDSHSFAAAMVRLAEHENLRRAMGGAAALRARERFDHRKMVRSYEALYDRLLPHGGSEKAARGAAA